MLVRESIILVRFVGIQGEQRPVLNLKGNNKIKRFPIDLLEICRQ